MGIVCVLAYGLDSSSLIIPGFSNLRFQLRFSDEYFICMKSINCNLKLITLNICFFSASFDLRCCLVSPVVAEGLHPYQHLSPSAMKGGF